MKNYDKYNRFKKVFDKLNSAMKNEYWLEAIFLEYSIFEDRLAACLAIMDINVFTKNGKQINIEEKLNKLKNINDEFLKSKISDVLIENIIDWKNERNVLMHNMLNNDISEISLRCLAIEGITLVKELNNKSRQIINRYKKMYQDRNYYMLKNDVYVRDIGEFGYIVHTGIHNDLVLDKSGKLFLLALSKKPETLEKLASKIAKSFVGITEKEVIADVKELFDILVEDGFVSRGNNKSEAILNSKGFSYDSIEKVKLKEDYTPKNTRSQNNSQEELDNYYREHPQLSSFQIELTSKCNERCIHCYIPHKYKDTDITDKLFNSVLKQLKEMNVLAITLSGGEPMCHPHFKDYLKKAKEMGFYVHVLSNLTNCDDNIIKIMKEGNKAAVQVSLYSMNAEEHDTITTIPGSFEKTKATILKLIRNDIPLQINCPVMKANKNSVADVIRWGHSHKVRVNVDYAIMAQYNHDTENLANRLTPEECRDVIKDIISCDEDYSKMIGDNSLEDFNNYFIDPESPFCGVGNSTCCMVANGNVYPCPGWQGYVCGNLNDMSLSDIWNNSDKMRWLRNLRKKDMPKCLKCKDRAFCSPCLSRFANESNTGNPLEIADHFCKVAKVNREVVQEQKNLV